MIKTTTLYAILTFTIGTQFYAQEVIEDAAVNMDTIVKNDTVSFAKDSVKQSFQKLKIDGVAASRDIDWAGLLNRKVIIINKGIPYPREGLGRRLFYNNLGLFPLVILKFVFLQKYIKRCSIV